MFKDCTVKYYKDPRTNENSCVMVTYPANENGISKAMAEKTFLNANYLINL